MAEPLKGLMDLPNQVASAADKVIETGLKERFDISFTVFGRKIGVAVEVSLLEKTGPR